MFDSTLRETHWPARAVSRVSVGSLFERLRAQLGNKMERMYNGVDPILLQQEWAQGLYGFSVKEVARGVNACAGLLFAPTLGEFLHLCRPALDGQIAWHEAEEGLKARRQGQMGHWSHPAVYHAAIILQDAVRQGEYRAKKNLWEHVLRTEFARDFIDPVPPVPVVPALTYDRQGGPMPEGIRAKLRASGIILTRTAGALQ